MSAVARTAYPVVDGKVVKEGCTPTTFSQLPYLQSAVGSNSTNVSPKLAEINQLWTEKGLQSEIAAINTVLSSFWKHDGNEKARMDYLKDAEKEMPAIANYARSPEDQLLNVKNELLGLLRQENGEKIVACCCSCLSIPFCDGVWLTLMSI